MTSNHIRSDCNKSPVRPGTPRPSPTKEAEAEAAEASCGAFGYLRGIRDQSAAVEFRFRDGNSIWFPYAWLGTWQYNPSEGLLLKFSGDLVYLVLIRGSNLDQPLNEGAINLTHAGLQRHRVLWIREMSERGNPASRRDRADHRQHRGGGVRVACRPQGMAQQERPGVRAVTQGGVLSANLLTPFLPDDWLEAHSEAHRPWSR